MKMDPSRSQLPQTLPSFREIVPPEMHQAIESAPFPSSANPSPIESPPNSQYSAPRSRSSVGSPIDGQPTIMPSVAEGFDGFSVRQARSGTRARTQPSRQPSEIVSGTSTNNSPYPNVARAYSVSTSHDAQHRAYGSFDSSPSLPPLRGLHNLQDRGHSRSDEHPFPPHSSGYRHNHGSLSDPEANPFHSSSAGSYDLPYRPQMCPPVSGVPGLVPADYARSEQLAHDATHRPSTFGSYPDLEYPQQLLSNQQYANYGMLGDATRRRRGNLPKHITDILKAWFQEHLDHPYPTEEDKRCLQNKTLLSIQQISNWFINARRRHLPALRAAQNRSSEHEQEYRVSHQDKIHCSSHEPSLSPI